MEEEILKICWIKDGKKTEWITIGKYYSDPKHPNRKFCYREGNSMNTIYFDDARNFQDVLSYLWQNVIDANVIPEMGIMIVVEKA